MSTALVKLPETFPIPLTAGDLDSYIRTVSAIPVLSASEEQHFARELRHDNNLDAARKLILSQLRFVVHIARSYTGYGLPLADLIQEGNIGLMKAVKRFDPDMGVRLISFAVHWIRSEIHEYVIRNWRIVKVATTKAQRKLFFKLRATKKRLGWFNEQEARAVANDLKVEPETVLEMEARLNGQDTAFDMRAGEDNDQAVAPASYLQQENADPALLLEHQDESQRDQEQLRVALEGLDARSRDIVRRRWLDEAKPTLHELAAEYSVSAERIRQLEKNAMRKLRRHLED